MNNEIENDKNCGICGCRNVCYIKRDIEHVIKATNVISKGRTVLRGSLAELCDCYVYEKPPEHRPRLPSEI